MELKDAIGHLAKRNTGFDATIELATVTALNEIEMTCDVILADNEELELFDVKLKPVVPGLDLTEMGMVSYPEIGSKVLIGQINNSDTDLFVILCSKVKKVSLDAGGLLKMAMDMQSGAMAFDLAKMVLNGGKNGGIPKVKPLLKRINLLEDRISDLYDKFNKHTHIGVTTGGGKSGLSTLKVSDVPLAPMELKDLENSVIQQ